MTDGWDNFETPETRAAREKERREEDRRIKEHREEERRIKERRDKERDRE